MMVRPKKVWSDLKSLFREDRYNEIDLSVEVCSLLTNSFLSVDKISLQAYSFLNIEGQVQLLNSIIKEEAGLDEVREFYGEVFKEVLEEVLS